jgi:hypothetical protein
MLRLMLKPAMVLTLVLASLVAAGCSQPLGNDMSFAKENKAYENALDARGKKAVISEMKKEQAQVQKAAGIEPESTASTKPAKTKKKQVEAKQQTEAAQN